MMHKSRILVGNSINQNTTGFVHLAFRKAIKSDVLYVRAFLYFEPDEKNICFTLMDAWHYYACAGKRLQPQQEPA